MPLRRCWPLQAATGQPGLLLDSKHGACTITTGPKPCYDKRAGVQDYLMTKGSAQRPSSSTYSPSCTLYPLTSLESYSNAGGDSADSQDLDMDVDMGDISLGTGLRGSGQTGSAESDAAEELGLRRSSRTSGGRKDKVRGHAVCPQRMSSCQRARPGLH